ncbi:MAG TPA: GNAT family N-acetyltransferase [Nocardioidaceae bacterium]|jgi:GNAT superfamily N-acetyltransferase
MPTDDRQVRRATPSDSDAIADLYTDIRDENLGPIPPPVHSREENHDWVRHILLPTHEVWVAERRGELIGFMALHRPDWLGHLYIRASATGHGLGSRFVELAKRELPGLIQLWTFQSNAGARRFYERHGFVAVQWTDGDNEEGAPDVRYELRRD